MCRYFLPQGWRLFCGVALLYWSLSARPFLLLFCLLFFLVRTFALWFCRFRIHLVAVRLFLPLARLLPFEQVGICVFFLWSKRDDARCIKTNTYNAINELDGIIKKKNPILRKERSPCSERYFSTLANNSALVPPASSPNSATFFLRSATSWIRWNLNVLSPTKICQPSSSLARPCRSQSPRPRLQPYPRVLRFCAQVTCCNFFSSNSNFIDYRGLRTR